MLVRELGIIPTLSRLIGTVELSYNLCQSPGKMFVIWWKSTDAFELWCWRLLRVPWTARRLNQSILKEINPGHLMQRVDSLEDPDAGKDWRQKEKRVTEDETVGWHHWLYGLELAQALGNDEGQRSLICYIAWGLKESDMTELLNSNKLVCIGLARGFIWVFPKDGTQNPNELFGQPNILKLN